VRNNERSLTNNFYSDSIMTSSTDIIVTTGLIAAGVGTLFGLAVHFGKRRPATSSGGGRRTRRARRANNGTRRS
jgi:hypothetical protein